LAYKAIEDKPIEQEDYWKKYGELDGVKEHVYLSLLLKK
jgi:hypothetical protein